MRSQTPREENIRGRFPGALPCWDWSCTRRGHDQRDRSAAPQFPGHPSSGRQTATGMEVPEEVVESLGSGRKPKMGVTIRGHTYRSRVAIMGGKFMLPVSAENRAGAGVEAGTRWTLNRTRYRASRGDSPTRFRRGARPGPPAEQHLTLVLQPEARHVLSIEGAKTVETRERRVAKSISSLD